MTARINSFQHTVAVLGAVLFTYGIVLFSAPTIPLA